MEGLTLEDAQLALRTAAYKLPIKDIDIFVLGMTAPAANEIFNAETVEYAGSAERLREVWIAVRSNLRAVLEHVTVGELARGELPAAIEALSEDPDAWQPH